MRDLSTYPGTPFDLETIEELSGYTVRDIVACYRDYDRAMAENEALKQIVKKLDDDCSYCWYTGREPKDCDCECMTCQRECGCRDCRDKNKWAWKDEGSYG